MKRRKFVKNTALAPLIAGSLLHLNGYRERKDHTPLKIGLCADVHQDFIPDGPERLSAFIDAMTTRKPDFIIQLGDFCQPDPANIPFMNIWNRFPGPKYHVIGNHDPEGEYTQDEVVDFWQALGKYYSFDLKNYHFVVLNGNERNPAHEKPWKYERYISKEQLRWLSDDLRKTDKPVILFCHQGIDVGGIENSLEVRRVLELANEEAGFKKVRIVFSGHHHKDYVNLYNDILYIQINSMSYHWQGKASATSPYGEEQHKKYPLLKYMAHYKDPLWALMEISSDGSLKLEGVESTFLGSALHKREISKGEFTYPAVSRISDREYKLFMD
ncbi:metallophosphoesterase [Sinomicrobium kalidii]|uniref:metallophosphoesterase family protein n=1 Tax=Sinomicrobium kalidii TaxID=2900738 RepID=UPI001E3375BA|nr:metallophosphoesterase [Sinomicrobium kalidii]UGU15934.1 metallophosphoesterase [Sinomicrobium kalidii]